MILFGRTFAMLMTFASVTCNVYDESHIGFLLENEKNESRHSFSWGLFDTSATVGVVFQYNISSVFPYGEDGEYVVSEAGSNNNTLPEWLQFDKVTGCLIGVPNPSDASKTFYLKVSVVNNHNSRLEVGDVFSIKVSEHSPYFVGSSARQLKSHDDASTLVQCLPGSAVTTTTVIIDADFNALLPADRVGIIQNLGKYLGLSLTAARLVSPGTMPLVDDTALVAGPGDVTVPLHAGVWLQWEVGCGNVFAYHMDILQKLEIASQNGDMSNHIGYGVIGWHVSNKKALHTGLNRLKRQAPVLLTTATAVKSTGPPASKVVPTITVSEAVLMSDPPSRVVPSPSASVYPSENGNDLHKPNRTKSRIKSKTVKDKVTRSSSPGIITPVQVIPTDASYEPNERITSSVSPFIDSDLQPSVIMPQATSAVPTASLDTKKYTSVVTQPDKVAKPSSAVSTSGALTDINVGTPTSQTTKQVLEDFGPRVNSELGTLPSTVRKVFVYKIPDHLFSDTIDGDTRNLKLEFSMPDNYDTNIAPWVKFNEVTQTLFGFPLSVSHQQYFLSATNSRGRSSRIGFYIKVQEPPKDQRVNFEMSVILEADYRRFINNVSALVDIATKISSAFGDEDPSQVMITSIHPGSVVYNWTNSSLSTALCPTDKILTLAQNFITPSGALNSHFLETLEPFIIRKAAVTPKSSCDFETIEAIVPLSASSPFPGSTDSPAVDEVETKTAETDFFLTTIVPIVIIVALVILAIIIACVLCCKRRKARLSEGVGGKSVKKGTPVIFTNELEDKVSASKKPLIMEKERPPQPPNYQQAAFVSSFPSTPRSECYEPLVSDNQRPQMRAGLISERPTHSSTSLQQRPMGSQHRNPPPYGAP